MSNDSCQPGRKQVVLGKKRLIYARYAITVNIMDPTMREDLTFGILDENADTQTIPPQAN